MKQHQLLAVEQDINSKTNGIIKETLILLNRGAAFDEHHKSYTPFEEGDKDIPEKDEKLMVTTVDERIAYTSKSIVNQINILASKEKTNQIAKANIVIKDDEGKVVETIAEDVPVSALLQLEKKMQEYRKIYEAMPTFNTEKHWIKGTNTLGVECYIIKDNEKKIRTRTETTTTMVDQNPIKGSDKYPLIPEKVQITKPVGEYETVVKTGKISPKQKADTINRLDKVIKAIKFARTEANSVEVVEMNFGKTLVDYING